MPIEPTQPEQREPDRRQSRRFATDQRVRFSDAGGIGPLRAGRTVDMSPSGMRVESTSGFPVGTRVDLEVEPGADSDVVMLRGRVTHESGSEMGRHTLGIATEYFVRSEPHDAGARRRIPIAAIAPQMRKVPRMQAPTPLPREPVRASGARRMLAAVVALAMLGLLSWWGSENEDLTADGRGAGRIWVPRAAAKALTQSPPPSMSAVAARIVTARAAAPHSTPPEQYQRANSNESPPAALTSRAQAQLDAGNAEGGLAHLDALKRNGRATTTQKFIAQIEQARISAMRGERGLAMDQLRNALAKSGTLPGVWTEPARRELAAMQAERNHVPRFGPKNWRLALANTEGEFTENPYTIEVDVSDFVLTVLRDSEPIAEFPVGLGRDGATPLGTFVIVDKIEDPDWYDRGRSVPAGSPENPLGESWMGLGHDGRGTGIGIHPTRNGGSIAQPMSEGCVRMRPKDAEALLRLVPKGTRVRIHE